MAKVRLQAGASVDLLSPEEHRADIEHLERALCGFMEDREGTTEVHSSTPFLTDASGNTSTLPDGGGGIYRVPAGYVAYLTRLVLDYETSNPGTPVTCGIKVCADAVTPAALRSISNQLPLVLTESKSHAPKFRAGQRIVVGVQGGPTTTNVYPTVQVLLIKIRPVLHHDELTEPGHTRLMPSGTMTEEHTIESPSLPRRSPVAY